METNHTSFIENIRVCLFTFYVKVGIGIVRDRNLHTQDGSVNYELGRLVQGLTELGLSLWASLGIVE